jgi:hypothetical protein
MEHAYKILIGKPEVKRLLGRPVRRGRDKIILKNQKSGWPGFIWLRIGPSGGLLGIKKLNFIFHKR